MHKATGKGHIQTTINMEYDPALEDNEYKDEILDDAKSEILTNVCYCGDLKGEVEVYADNDGGKTTIKYEIVFDGMYEVYHD